MSQDLQLSQVVPFGGIACAMIFHFLNKPQHIVNPQNHEREIHVLPWVLEINYGIAYLMYSQFQGDDFLFVQAIPLLMSGMAQTLHWHPFYNKKIRRFHEYLLFFSLAIVLIANAATTVYFKSKNTSVQRIGSGAPVVLMSFLTAATLLVEKWRLLIGTQPDGKEVMACAFGFASAALWTVYGFWGTGGDWVVCSSGIIFLVFGVGHAAMIVYAIIYNGGIDMGWDNEEESDADIMVDRFNREPAVVAHPIMNTDMSFGRRQTGQEDAGEGSRNEYPARSRRSQRESGYAPEFAAF
ncbi:hypothetical protein HK100_000528 [Physocladia obscura]|uniref:Uncharacterized protein n=1 Tax=Physocladia obscura TaxID=109957 RepID=A0AAD5T038_9FUNG|nr:hypothetical protein HK100_000528 [Physocladia obscura]